MTGTRVKLLRSAGIVTIAFTWMTASSRCAEPATPDYHFEPAAIVSRLDDQQIALLEKLNRTDRAHLRRVGQLVAPDSWTADELWYSPLPAMVREFEPHSKLVFVSLPDQVFGGYENGLLTRWGPICSGRAAFPTPQGLYYLNWRSRESRVYTAPLAGCAVAVRLGRGLASQFGGPQSSPPRYAGPDSRIVCVLGRSSLA